MNSINPLENSTKVEKYLSEHLKREVKMTGFEQFARSTREAPWKINTICENRKKSFVLYLDPKRGEHEFSILRAVEIISIPTPLAYGWDASGEALGIPSFFTEFIEGESLLKYLLAHEPWAEDLYIETARRLQSVKRSELSDIANRLDTGESAADILEKDAAYFKENPNSLADKVCEVLKKRVPSLPDLRFSNGDLYPDNMLVLDKELVGVIDFETAGFSDPIFEFLLPFFLHPELCGRGIEEKYCRLMGYNSEWLPWYHGLEFFDTWRWTLQSGKSWEQHTSESLKKNLETWLEEFQ